MKKQLPPAAAQVLDAYVHFSLGNEEVSLPYVTNKDRAQIAGERVYVGKGSPEELKEEAFVIAHAGQIALDTLDRSALRMFLKEHRLGVDCSGFIAQVLYPFFGKKLFLFPGLSWLEKVKVRMRPFENTSVSRLKKMASLVDLKDTEPGDIIITRGVDHALLVTTIERDESGVLTAIEYAHSTGYFTENGVRKGTIEIVDPALPLEQQTWHEGDGEENFTHQGYLVGKEKNGVYRIHAKVKNKNAK